MLFAPPASLGPQRNAARNFHPLTPLFATLTALPQMPENTTTLSSAFATLTSRVKPKSCVCHSYKKHPGWGYVIVNFFVAQTSVCALLRQSASESSVANDPQELNSLAVHRITSHEAPPAASALFLPPVTSHKSLTPVESALTKKPGGHPLAFIAALRSLCHNHRSCIAARIGRFRACEDSPNP
jgi:hypothetical protein